MLLKWCRGLCFHIYHWNFAINFFLYCLTGEKFRKVVLQTLGQYKNMIFSICTKHINKCIFCPKYSTHLKSVQSSNILLIRTIALSDQSISGSISAQNNMITNI